MMFNVGSGELLVIAVIALIVLGPQHLPGAIRTFGRVVGEVRRISNGFQQELRDAFEDSEVDEDSNPLRRREEAPAAAAVAEADQDFDAAAGDAAAHGQDRVPQNASEPQPDGGAATSTGVAAVVDGAMLPVAALPDRPASDGAPPDDSRPEDERAPS